MAALVLVVDRIKFPSLYANLLILFNPSGLDSSMILYSIGYCFSSMAITFWINPSHPFPRLIILFSLPLLYQGRRVINVARFKVLQKIIEHT